MGEKTNFGGAKEGLSRADEKQRERGGRRGGGLLRWGGRIRKRIIR